MARKQKIGIVVTDKMDKSIVVSVETKLKHKLYGKTMLRTKRYLAHDPDNIGMVGNTVLLEEHPPLSAKKRWILKTVLK